MLLLFPDCPNERFALVLFFNRKPMHIAVLGKGEKINKSWQILWIKTVYWLQFEKVLFVTYATTFVNT
jgi:hypothetical protein